MERDVRMDKNERRAAVARMLSREPSKTDRELADAFGVSVATVRLDRKMLGIPQMKDRLEAAVAGAGTADSFHDMTIIALEKGKSGLALVKATEEMASEGGIIPAERLYGISAELARAVIGEPFAPTQVGNIKYKTPCGAGVQLVASARVSHMRGSRQYIHVQITTKETEVFRAKFIMNVLNENEGDWNGKNSG